MISIEVPGRICFFGDHQDYLDLPIIAGAIDRTISLTATPQEVRAFTLTLPDLNQTRNIDLDDTSPLEPNDYYRSALHTLSKYGVLPNQGYAVTITGNLPINSGLSSSSAVIVTWIRFLICAFGKNKSFSSRQIGQWAFESEVLNFNQPGGMMDQYTIAHKGLGFLDTTTGNWTPIKPNLGSLVVAVSGIEKQTLGVLGNAKKYTLEALKIVQEKDPSFILQKAQSKHYGQYKAWLPKKLQPYWYGAIENYQITLAAFYELQLQTPDFEKLGQLMNAHQQILKECIQNTPDAMDKMMQAALQAGALGTKIVGSGGGGAMVALATKSTQQQICEAFLSHGAQEAFSVNLTPPDADS